MADQHVSKILSVQSGNSQKDHVQITATVNEHLVHQAPVQIQIHRPNPTDRDYSITLSPSVFGHLYEAIQLLHKSM